MKYKLIEKRQRQEEKILRSLKKRKQETNKKINVTRTKLITQDFSHLTAKARFHIRYFSEDKKYAIALSQFLLQHFVCNIFITVSLELTRYELFNLNFKNKRFQEGFDIWY